MIIYLDICFCKSLAVVYLTCEKICKDGISTDHVPVRNKKSFEKADTGRSSSLVVQSFVMRPRSLRRLIETLTTWLVTRPCENKRDLDYYTDLCRCLTVSSIGQDVSLTVYTKRG